MNVKDGILVFNCSECNTDYKKDFNKDLTKRFESTFKFCEKNMSKCCLML